MDSEEFRLHAHALADWMADYLKTVGERRIVPEVEPGDIRKSLPPSPPEREQPVIDWPRQLCGLPKIFPGVIKDPPSTATLVALISARTRAGGLGRPLVVYASKEAHASVDKGVRLAGFAAGALRHIEVD